MVIYKKLLEVDKWNNLRGTHSLSLHIKILQCFSNTRSDTSISEMVRKMDQ